MTVLLELLDVSKRYGSGEAATLALDGVSLRIDDGESIAVVGPSGSGKTTLLHIAALVERPSQGKVCLSGQDCNALGERERARIRLVSMGLAFDAEPLLETLTVRDNIALLLAAAGVPTAEHDQRIGEALERFSIGSHASKYSYEISAGERQRVTLARALAKRPALVVADEPTAHLDSKRAERIARCLCETGRGRAVLFATHDLEVAAVATRQIALRDGRLVER